MRHVETVRSFAEIDVAARSIVLCDLDGCLISGRHVHEGARAFVDACGDRLWIVSNNSSDTAGTLAARLDELGIIVDAGRILLAGEESVRRLADDPQAKAALVYADAPLRSLATSLGIANDAGVPEVLLLGRDSRFSLELAEEIASHIVDGAVLWATNLDLTHPTAHGRPVPETGALVAAIEACTGPLSVKSIGKPSSDLIEIALERSGADRGRALFVGDNDATDGVAARAAGIDFLRILHSAIAPKASTVPHLNGGREVVSC